MSERFTERLRAASEPAWSDAVRHRFVNELFAGAVPDAVMGRYLIQDHRFLDSFLTLLGAALASADTFEARVRFGRFIGMVSGEENTFFLRAFEALGVTEDRRAADPDTQPTAGFKAIMREAAETCSYAAALSVLVVAERLYLDWASQAPKPLPDNFVHAEWITLHDNPDFRGFVDFLRAELDRVGPYMPTCAATSSVGLSSSNSHSSTPPMPSRNRHFPLPAAWQPSRAALSDIATAAWRQLEARGTPKGATPASTMVISGSEIEEYDA